MGAFLFAPGTCPVPPVPVKFDIFALAPKSRCKSVEFYRDRRHSAGAWGRQKGAQDSPNHVDVNSEDPMQKRRVLRGSAAAAGAGGEGDISLRDRG